MDAAVQSELGLHWSVVPNLETRECRFVFIGRNLDLEAARDYATAAAAFPGTELAAKALEIARVEFGAEFAPDQVFVIGDTPRDVECGRQIQAKTVAVATGKYSVNKLAESKPDYLFRNLSDIEAFLAIIDGVAVATVYP